MPSSMLYSHLQQQQQSSRLQSNQLQGSNQSLMQIPPVHPSSQALQQPSPTWAKLKEAMYLYFGPLNCKEFYGGFDCDTPPRKRKGFKFDKLDFNFNGPGDFDLDMGFSKEKKSEKSNECGKDNSSIQDVSSASRKELASNNNRSNDGDLETENILEFGVTSKCKDDTRTSNPRKSDGGHVSHTNSMENPSINAATQGTLSSLRSSIVSLEENASVLGFSKFADKSQDMQAQYPNMKNLSTLYGKLVDIANHPGTKSIAKVSEVSPFKIFLKFLKLEEKGLIMSSQSVLIEPISENIGIGLAFMAAPKGTFIWPRTGWRGMSFSVVVLEIAVLATGFLVIAVDGKFPGPVLNVTTNYNVVFNVLNSLDEDLLITWAGIQQRKNSWQQGVLGTNCPIPSDWNWTYQFRVKYQINSFIYFPSLGFQRAVGGYGGITINNRAVISVPFGQPDGDYHIFIGNWYNKNHTDLRKALSDGKDLGMPDGVLINGKGPYRYNDTLVPDGIEYETINVHPGKTYRIRVHNVGISTSLNFRIQNHNMLLVETEGSYTVQQNYTNLDIHCGQSYSFLVTTDQNASSDYYIVASARMVNESLWKRVTGVAILRYSNSKGAAHGPLPDGPNDEFDKTFSMNQARSVRWNVTASGARPNPQGSFRYGSINVTQLYVLKNTPPVKISGKHRTTLNGLSFVNPETPIRLADSHKVKGVYKLDFPERPITGPPRMETSVINATYRGFMEIIFQNNDTKVQSYHLDGYAFFVVGMDYGEWTENSRGTYNKWDGVARCTVQVFPGAWTAVMISLDNVGVWNLRAENLDSWYLGQETYIRVVNQEATNKTELPEPDNALYCGALSRLQRQQTPHGHGKSAASTAVAGITTLALSFLLIIVSIFR